MQDTRYMDAWIHVPLCRKGEKLYHYTTAEGVRGIVENREFYYQNVDVLPFFRNIQKEGVRVYA